MPRVTISLSDRAFRALKVASVRLNRSMGSIIEESLQLARVRPFDTAKEIVAKARARSGLSADKAMVLAVGETRRFRGEK